MSLRPYAQWWRPCGGVRRDQGGQTGLGATNVRAMCAACVAQGIGYVGTALVGLQVMGARAKAKRRSGDADADEASVGAVPVPVEQPVDA